MQYRTLLFILFSFLCFFGFIRPVLAQEEEEVLEGVVTHILETRNTEFEGVTQHYQKLQLTVTQGSITDRVIIIESGDVPVTNSPVYKIGDRVLVGYSKGPDGQDFFYITDYVRRDELLYLVAFFVVLTIVVGGIRGGASLLGMGLSFVVIFKVILPLIVDGWDPVLVSILGAALIIPVTFYLAHGFNKKAHVAIVSTFITLALVGFLAESFVTFTRLSGFSSDEASFVISQLGNTFNMKGLLLAGIIISSLGVLDDITISQASIVAELRSANIKLQFRELFVRAMRVGRDHISSLVNTLVLVYAGASLPLLLLVTQNPKPLSTVMNLEMIAEEIVKTIVGSTGLILAVPITTVLAAFAFQKSTKKQKDSGKVSSTHLHVH